MNLNVCLYRKGGGLKDSPNFSIFNFKLLQIRYNEDAENRIE